MTFVLKDAQQLRAQLDKVSEAIGLSIAPEVLGVSELDTDFTHLKQTFPYRATLYRELLRGSPRNHGPIQLAPEDLTRATRVGMANNYQSALQSGSHLPPGKHLRDIQQDCLDIIATFLESERERGQIKLPTGAGKTALFCVTAKALSVTCAIIVPRRNLIQQTRDSLAEWAPDLVVGDFYSDGSHDFQGKDVVVTTYQNLPRFIHEVGHSSERFPAIILDEVHYAETDRIQSLIKAIPGANLILGFSATPTKNIYSFLGEPIHEVQLPDAIRSGICSGVRAIVIGTNISLKDTAVSTQADFSPAELRALDTYQRNEAIPKLLGHRSIRDKSVVVSCLDITHTKKMAKLINDSGVGPALAIHSDLPRGEDKVILQKFEERNIRVLCQVDMLNEGWDSKVVEVGIFARPTRSKKLAEQRLGRITRATEQKPFAIAIDIVDGLDDSPEKVGILCPHVLEGHMILPEDLGTSIQDIQHRRDVDALMRDVDSLVDLDLGSFELILSAERVFELLPESAPQKFTTREDVVSIFQDIGIKSAFDFKALSSPYLAGLLIDTVNFNGAALHLLQRYYREVMGRINFRMSCIPIILEDLFGQDGKRDVDRLFVKLGAEGALMGLTNSQLQAPLGEISIEVKPVKSRLSREVRAELLLEVLGVPLSMLDKNVPISEAAFYLAVQEAAISDGAKRRLGTLFEKTRRTGSGTHPGVSRAQLAEMSPAEKSEHYRKREDHGLIGDLLNGQLYKRIVELNLPWGMELEEFCAIPIKKTDGKHLNGARLLRALGLKSHEEFEALLKALKENRLGQALLDALVVSGTDLRPLPELPSRPLTKSLVTSELFEKREVSTATDLDFDQHLFLVTSALCAERLNLWGTGESVSRIDVARRRNELLKRDYHDLSPKERRRLNQMNSFVADTPLSFETRLPSNSLVTGQAPHFPYENWTVSYIGEHGAKFELELTYSGENNRFIGCEIELLSFQPPPDGSFAEALSAIRELISQTKALVKDYYSNEAPIVYCIGESLLALPPLNLHLAKELLEDNRASVLMGVLNSPKVAGGSCFANNELLANSRVQENLITVTDFESITSDRIRAAVEEHSLHGAGLRALFRLRARDDISAIAMQVLEKVLTREPSSHDSWITAQLNQLDLSPCEILLYAVCALDTERTLIDAVHQLLGKRTKVSHERLVLLEDKLKRFCEGHTAGSYEHEELVAKVLAGNIKDLLEDIDSQTTFEPSLERAGQPPYFSERGRLLYWVETLSPLHRVLHSTPDCPLLKRSTHQQIADRMDAKDLIDTKSAAQCCRVCPTTRLGMSSKVEVLWAKKMENRIVTRSIAQGTSASDRADN